MLYCQTIHYKSEYSNFLSRKRSWICHLIDVLWYINAPLYWVINGSDNCLLLVRRHPIIWTNIDIQYIPRNMHTVFALLCFVVVIHWLIFPYPSGLLHWHCGNLTIAPVPAKQQWWLWINTSCEFIMNDFITTTKQSTTKPCAYFLGYTVLPVRPKGTHFNETSFEIYDV